MIGTTVGKYRVLERLGRGGMGIVYKALDETLDREVAIKVLNPDVDDAELLKRFRGEAISLARLNHPGIATIYELHRHGDDLLMVMEYVRGETLQTLSERLGPLEPPQAAHICVQILDALAHAHRAGIVHRDLKPANVMVTDIGVVKIMDFGIARMLGGEHFTHAGYMMGTPAYMAPEQVLGHEIDGRADLYSVGVLFYRLLTRELPFQADTAIAMAQKQVAEAPTPLRTFRPNLPPWCEAIIARSLSKGPDDRFQSAEAFRSAILSAVRPAPIGDLPTMATPTPASLLKTSDLTLPLTGELTVAAQTATRAFSDATVTVASTPPPGGGSSGAATPGSGVIAPTERTGTTVVLGRGHLFALAAMILILIGGIAALGYVALKRSGVVLQTATAPPTVSSDPAPPEQQPASQPSATDSAASVPAESQPVAKSESAAPPAVPPAPASSTGTSASGTAGREDKGAKPKPPPKTVERTSAPPIAPSADPPPVAAAPAPEPAPPAPKLPPLTFDAVKIVLAEGNDLRDRDAVLRLSDDHLSVLDRSGNTEILSLGYSSVAGAFYSRSKQPKWKGPDGKEQEASVDLGALGFFRGDRNWVILTTPTGRVILRVENDDLQPVLSAISQRTGMIVQR
jgi:serine/threonine-protein kinase